MADQLKQVGVRTWCEQVMTRTVTVCGLTSGRWNHTLLNS